MAISGAGGWTPSTGATIRNRTLVLDATTQNKPPAIVVDDMSLAADLLRHDPAAHIQVDVRGGNISRLRAFLEASGHIDAGPAQQGGSSHRQRSADVDAGAHPGASGING
jgi:hypothetical protein